MLGIPIGLQMSCRIYSFYAHTSACVYVYVFLRMYVYVYMCMYVYIYIYIHTYTHIQNSYTHVCTYIYIYIYTYISIYIYVCVYAKMPFSKIHRLRWLLSQQRPMQKTALRGGQSICETCSKRVKRVYYELFAVLFCSHARRFR